MRQGLRNLKLMAAVEWLTAIFILGLAVYFMPLLFIGLIVGIYVGKNYDKILAWLDEVRKALDNILVEDED